MSVAETTVPRTASVRTSHQTLALRSLLGGGLLLAALWALFGGLPLFWSENVEDEDKFNPYLASALLLVLTLLFIVGLILVFRKLERQYEHPGLRAGVVFAALFWFLALWLTRSIAALLETRHMGRSTELIIAGVVAAGLVFLVRWLIYRPGWTAFMQGLEEKGWFHALSYKRNQGVRVRRGTILAALVVGACGIYSLYNSGLLKNRFGSNDWEWTVPFTAYEAATAEELYLPLMYNVHLVIPFFLLPLLLIWFAWRLVNWPTFADFLIATDAEMNKVSWTTRKRLVQDTIVVLATMFLMTMFLFLVDILWIQILSWRPIHVLQVDIKAERKKQQEKSQW